MGGLFSMIGFGPSTGRRPIEVIKMDEIKSTESLVHEIMGTIMINLYRDEIYRCDFYRGLDQRVPTDDTDKTILWRMNVDHPLVYVLIHEKGQQPIHITEDKFGELVVYNDEDVTDGINYLISLCTSANYTILNDPITPEELEEKEKINK